MLDFELDLAATQCCDYGETESLTRAHTDTAEVSIQLRTKQLVEAISADVKMGLANRKALWDTGKALIPQVVEAS